MPKSNEEKAEHVALMKDAEEWSWYPLCPVKRYSDGKMQAAVITPGKPIVYLKNLFSIEGDDLAHALKDVPTVAYPTFEAMVEDGWEVD